MQKREFSHRSVNFVRRWKYQSVGDKVRQISFPLWCTEWNNKCIGSVVIAVYSHRINTQPEVRDSAAAIFLSSVHGKCLRYTEDVDVVFTKKNSSLFTLERGRWIRMLCDSSNLQKQKLVKPKPLANKMAIREKIGTKKWAKSDFWLSIYSVV